MEPDGVDQAVDVLQELPGQAGLADPGRADDRDESGPAIPARRVEQILDLAELVVAADERGLEPLRAVPAASLGHDPEGTPGRHRAGLALEDLIAGLLEDDRGRCRPLGRLADEDGPGRRDRLQPARRVDEIAGDHALVRGAERHGGLAGQDAGPRRDPRPEGADRVDELEPGPDGSLGVVLVGGRRAPDGHDGVADELLDRPAVPADDVPRQVEVPAQQLAGVLGVPSLGEGREPDEIREQDADDASLGDRRHGGVRGGTADRHIRRRRAGHSRAAFAAELGVCRDRSPARGAADHEGLTALDAELAAGLVDLAAACTGQRALHEPTLGLERNGSGHSGRAPSR